MLCHCREVGLIRGVISALYLRSVGSVFLRTKTTQPSNYHSCRGQPKCSQLLFGLFWTYQYVRQLGLKIGCVIVSKFRSVVLGIVVATRPPSMRDWLRASRYQKQQKSLFDKKLSIAGRLINSNYNIRSHKFNPFHGTVAFQQKRWYGPS